jgi:hypothetical protein
LFGEGTVKMKLKRQLLMAMVVMALVAFAVPVIGLRAGAAGRSTEGRPKVGAEGIVGPEAPIGAMASGQQETVRETAGISGKKVDRSIYDSVGIPQVPGNRKATEYSLEIANSVTAGLKAGGKAKAGDIAPQAGEPVNMCAGSAMSAAIITSEGGRNTQFDEILTLGDWDGREDYVADHSGKVDDFSGKVPTVPNGPNEFTLTREAISEHTIANGFNEDIFYYGDSFGNLYIGATTNLTSQVPPINVFAINLPTAAFAFGSLATDDQIVITGICVNPIADLGSFARVNGAYASFNGLPGEIVYVTFLDTETGFRTTNGTNVGITQSGPSLFRSGVLAFPVADIVSGATAPPGIESPTGFPVQVGGAFGVAFSVFDNFAGCCVDDDGSVYFSQLDLIQFTGGNIVKIASTDVPGVCGVTAGFQDRSLATNGFLNITSLNPTLGRYGTASGPATQVNTFTNYSGTSSLFGNIFALTCGPCNTIYAGVSASNDAGTDPTITGFFSTGGTALGATPSMIIRFADVVGAFAPCTVPHNPITGQPITTTPGVVGLPIGDGFADPAQAGIPLAVPPAPAGVATLTPGVNNFRVFVEGNGPDIRSTTGTSAAIGATAANTLRIAAGFNGDTVGLQVDPDIHAGLTCDEEGTVYVVSGGTPAGIGKNSSPGFGEILVFPDQCPADGRADFIDLRGVGALPNPPTDSAVGDGLSTRADHIFWQAPLDGVSATPTGIAGLNRGFLMYLNRNRTEGGTIVDRFSNLPAPGNGLSGGGVIQGDDTSNGPVIFEQFDPCHQVAGGDDQVFPFTGDDDDGAGNPPVPGPLSGGFEFLFANPLGDVFAVGAACGTGNGVWNGFFLNSNGNITFGAGSTANIANVPLFRAGPPMIAAAWFDLNPGSRNGGFLNTFPVQAMGFAAVNDFAIRNIDIPEFGFECCNSSNTFGTFLFDDGIGVDENANQPLNPANPIGNNAVAFDLLEGPTANRFMTVTIPGQPLQIVGCPPRLDGTGNFCLVFCRMDVLGTPDDPVITGFSIGNQNPLNPPGLCSTDLSAAARAADTDPFRPCLIGEGTEPEIFELFNTAHGPSIGSGGEITNATPVFDLRFEGNDPGLAAAINTRQTSPNRGRVCFFGTTCQLPPNPICLTVIPTLPVVVAPGQPAIGSAAAATPNGAGVKVATPTAGIINALCNVQLNMIGCGIIPNETTIICQGFADETGIPLQRAGKTVTNALVLTCDTNGDGVPDLAIPLTNVTPVSKNLITGVLSTLGTQLPTTAFPLACCGGFATLTNTVTFTAGNNNIFNLLSTGGFTRTTTCPLDLGLRAPVVLSATPSTGDCSQCQDLTISGACFVLPSGALNVTTVFAVDAATGATVSATRFAVINANFIDALFCFGSANAGHTFLIFVSGPSGTSQNLTTLPAGTTCPAGTLGNQQGIQVTFKCNSPGTTTRANAAVVTACEVDRTASGSFVLTITGTHFTQDASVTVGGGAPKKLKISGAEVGATTFNTITAKGKFCGNLPGQIVVQNPGEAASAAFQCTQQCQ